MLYSTAGAGAAYDAAGAGSMYSLKGGWCSVGRFWSRRVVLNERRWCAAYGRCWIWLDVLNERLWCSVQTLQGSCPLQLVAGAAYERCRRGMRSSIERWCSVRTFAGATYSPSSWLFLPSLIPCKPTGFEFAPWSQPAVPCSTPNQSLTNTSRSARDWRGSSPKSPGWMDWMDRWMDGLVGWLVGWLDGWMDGWMDG